MSDQEKELKFIAHCVAYDASSALHNALNLIYLLPDSEKKREATKKLIEITDVYSKFLDEYVNPLTNR